MLQPDSLGQTGLQMIAFVRGWWFDAVTSSYILMIPLVIATVCALADYYGKRLYKTLTIYLNVLNGMVLAISAANLPYFAYFFKNINSSVLNWVEYGKTTIGMITQEREYIFALLYFLVGMVLLVYYSYRMYHCYRHSMSKMTSSISGVTPLRRVLEIGLTGIAVIGLCLFGIRGRIGYNPIKVSAAYYCNDPMLNQIGLNPAFNMLITCMDDMRSENVRLQLMDEEKALKEARQFLSVPTTDSRHLFARPVSAAPSSSSDNPNVVMVFMESMSASLMTTFGQKELLTPFLDSLASKSVLFTNIYSAGIHTNHGLYSTLYSFPTIMKRNAMKGSNIPRYSGLPTVLRDNGYHTMFFMTHESQYDNMNAFFRTNGYQDIYSQEDYPREKIVNSFGVPDDYLFTYAFEKINEQASHSKAPFFATLLTISNHPPYILPDGFKGRTSKLETQIVEYADRSLARFMQMASRQPWFENTLFVFLGDHGKLVGTPESEMPESYNHIPLMFYSSKIESRQIRALGGQIDVAPTLLGMLHISYNRDHLGVDLLKEERPCIFYTADNLIACRDNHHLYISNPSDKKEYKYDIRDNGEMIPDRSSDKRFLFLKEYAFSMLQTTEYIVRNGMTY